MILSLQKSTDKQSLEIYKEILNKKDEFDNYGIQIVDLKQESLTPGFTEGIIAVIIGGVSVNYVVRFIDFVIEKIKSRRYYNTQLIIKYKGKTFFIPENKDECIKFFREIEQNKEDV